MRSLERSPPSGQWTLASLTHCAASRACVARAGTREAHSPRDKEPGLQGAGVADQPGGVSRVIHSVHDCDP
jgi:hypothetical protein